MTERARLTDALALAARPREREYAVHDAALQGFMLRVQPNGARFWVFRFPRDGKARRVTPGKPEAVKAERARAAALAFLARERGGGDPVPLPASGPTLAKFAAEYVERRPSRGRLLGADDLTKLGAVLRRRENDDPVCAAAVRLILLTGCRPGEIRCLRRCEVRPDRLALEDAKTGPRHVLLGAARELLAGSPERRPGSGCSPAGTGTGRWTRTTSPGSGSRRAMRPGSWRMRGCMTCGTRTPRTR